jgi:hypothetical protein
MSKLVLIGLVMTILSCYPNRGNVIYPLTKRDLLRFLNSKQQVIQVYKKKYEAPKHLPKP